MIRKVRRGEVGDKMLRNDPAKLVKYEEALASRGALAQRLEALKKTAFRILHFARDLKRTIGYKLQLKVE
jgi:hypothetical protein